MMIKPILYKIIDLFSPVRIKSADVNAMSIVKGGTWWVKVFIRLLSPIGLSVTGPRVRAIVVIFKRISTLGQQQGIRGLVIYLKACHVCLTQALAGHKIKDTSRLGCRVSRTNKGYPRLILSSDRIRVLGNEPGILRFYQTVFGLYRILSFEGKLRFGSITNPFSGSESFIMNDLVPLIPSFIAALPLHKVTSLRDGGVTWIGGLKRVITPGRPAMYAHLLGLYAELKPLWLAKSAAGTDHEGIQVSSHPFLMLRTVRTIMSSPIYADFKTFFKLFPVNAPFTKAFEAAEKVAHYFKPMLTLGKIGVKEEAAGKVRLFAMAPTWFQILLDPIHRMVFQILSHIEQDGTFDQIGPLTNHAERFKESYSLDLTAATDRLPLKLQIAILSEMIGPEIANAWARLLTEIEYSLHSVQFGVSAILKYAVGQPMGALSSWAMLALTHHFLVQASAWKAGVVPVGVWFKDYAILGDDLVIFNRAVAEEYIRVIRLIGMEIGLAKSVLCRKGTTMEFAKRIFHQGNDISAVPLKEYFAALSGYGDILQFSRKYNLSRLELARVLGFKYQALSRVSQGFKNLGATMKKLVVAQALPTTASEVIPFFELGKPKVSPWPVEIGKFFSEFTQVEFRNLLNTISKRYTAILNDVSLIPNIAPGLGKDPLLLDMISLRYCVPILPYDQANWSLGPSAVHKVLVGGEEIQVIPGPAEAKEIAKGFMVFHDPENLVSQPLMVRGFRPYSPGNLRAISSPMITEGMIKNIRVALAALFDFQILPERDAVLEASRAVQSLVVSKWLLPDDMQQVLLNFLEISREAALVPARPVSFARVNSPERGKDPISLRLWRRWAKLLQGTVFRRTLTK